MAVPVTHRFMGDSHSRANAHHSLVLNDIRNCLEQFLHSNRGTSKKLNMFRAVQRVAASVAAE